MRHESQVTGVSRLPQYCMASDANLIDFDRLRFMRTDVSLHSRPAFGEICLVGGGGA